LGSVVFSATGFCPNSTSCGNWSKILRHNEFGSDIRECCGAVGCVLGSERGWVKDTALIVGKEARVQNALLLGVVVVVMVPKLVPLVTSVTIQPTNIVIPSKDLDPKFEATGILLHHLLLEFPRGVRDDLSHSDGYWRSGRRRRNRASSFGEGCVCESSTSWFGPTRSTLTAVVVARATRRDDQSSQRRQREGRWGSWHVERQ
jgi:hypothetical protein